MYSYPNLIPLPAHEVSCCGLLHAVQRSATIFCANRGE